MKNCKKGSKMYNQIVIICEKYKNNNNPHPNNCVFSVRIMNFTSEWSIGGSGMIIFLVVEGIGFPSLS